MAAPSPRPPLWPYRLEAGADLEALRGRIEETAARSQYGWGQTVDFGPFTETGFLGDKWQRIGTTLDELGWLPADLSGQDVADVGCFTGTLSLTLAARGARRVLAVDEVPEHLDQARLLADTFAADAVEPVEASLYTLHEHVEPASLDVILLSGVLYHLSDMLTGLMAMQQLLRPGGVLLMQTNAVENYTHSYANFGRFYAGWWWQPTALCIQDMCEFAGLERADVHFYESGRCVARAVKPLSATDGEAAIPFKRGVHWQFEDLRDAVSRTRDTAVMAPAPDIGAEGALLRRWGTRVVYELVRLPLRLANLVRRRLR